MVIRIVAAFVLTPAIAYAGNACFKPTQLPAIQLTTIALQSRECQAAELLRLEPVRLGYDFNPIGQSAFRTRLDSENLCLESAFKACHSGLKNAISAEELKARFADWIKNPKYRMLDGQVHCHERAYLLAKELTEAGFEVNLVQIENAPTLIAIERDSAELRYHDYRGHHWVVQIKVDNPNHGDEPMLLDPQFADEPMTRKTYFEAAIGQDCRLGKASDNPAECNYHVLPANSLARPRPDGQPILTEECGWSNATDHEANVLQLNRLMAEKKFPRAANIGVGSFRASKVRSQLIQAGWKKTEAELIDKIEGSKKTLNFMANPPAGVTTGFGGLPRPEQAGDIRRVLDTDVKNLERLQERMKQLGYK